MSSKNVGPVPARPGNINLQTFPPPVESESLKNITLAIEQITIAGAVGLVIVWWFVAFGSGYVRFFWRTGLLAAFGVVLWMAAGVAARNVEHELERVRMQMHKQRADQFSPPVRSLFFLLVYTLLMIAETDTRISRMDQLVLGNLLEVGLARHVCWHSRHGRRCHASFPTCCRQCSQDQRLRSGHEPRPNR